MKKESVCDITVFISSKLTVRRYSFRDSAGNLYGYTFHGGAYDRGSIYKLAPDGSYHVLHSFDLANYYDRYPDHLQQEVTVAKDGALYGARYSVGEPAYMVYISIACSPQEPWIFCTISAGSCHRMVSTSSWARTRICTV